MRRRNPPQVLRTSPPRIIPIPKADSNQESSKAPFPKWFTTNKGRREKPGLTRKLMRAAPKSTMRSPFHPQM